MEGRYEFVSPEWDDISDQAKDMVRINRAGARGARGIEQGLGGL